MFQDVCTGNKTAIFETSGDHGPGWRKATVNILPSSVPHDYRVNIAGTIGPTFHGDMALDDITISNYSCTG